MDEKWADVIDYEGLYKISNNGQVMFLGVSYYIIDKNGRSLKINKPLRKSYGSKNSYGYLSFTLYNNGYSKKIKIHRIVATAFLPNPEKLPCINHKNGIKSDNRVENLEWCTHKENSIHAYKTGLSKWPDNFKENSSKRAKERTGSKSYVSKKVVDTITGYEFESISEAAKSIGMKPKTLSAIFTGQNKNKTTLILK